MNEIFNPFWGGKQAVHSTIRTKRSIIVNQRRSVLTQLTWLVGYLPLALGWVANGHSIPNPRRPGKALKTRF